jgi:hypothetical protein
MIKKYKIGLYKKKIDKSKRIKVVLCPLIRNSIVLLS